MPLTVQDLTTQASNEFITSYLQAQPRLAAIQVGIAKAASGGAHVVKAFNTLYSNVLAAGPADGRRLDVFIAGDDAQAKTRVSAFIESLGLRPMDTGQLPMARTLENAGLLMLGLVAHSVKHTNFSLGVSILS
ncbi:dinucleotide-binding protein-like protein [Parafrankia sp. EAN1pec]|nr:dinucleotide-binding protein-like protein [Frankia sp. EAN1pec]